MNLNKWIRQTHRWLSLAITLGVIVNFVAVALRKYNVWVGLLALIPFALLMLTGLYLFALPYIAKMNRWQVAKRPARAAFSDQLSAVSQTARADS
ncbi:MAG TPA: hypothetical protein VKU01_29745 [Bryobacteraceae bacterium]|nr:hypothetical protein [Bryobacteraceae bacterium]